MNTTPFQIALKSGHLIGDEILHIPSSLCPTLYYQIINSEKTNMR